MKPGATTCPPASSTRSPSRFGPIAATFPSVMATSARVPGAPVPSTTVPPLMTRSALMRSPVGIRDVISVWTATREQVQRVGHGGKDHFDALERPVARPGQVAHQCLTDGAAHTAPEHAERLPGVSLARRIASAMPGASRSITRRVPSGVRSRGPNPVPPVVTTSPAKPTVSPRERARDLVDAVGGDRVGQHVEAGFDEARHDLRSRVVGAGARDHAVGHDEHLGSSFGAWSVCSLIADSRARPRLGSRGRPPADWERRTPRCRRRGCRRRPRPRRARW